MPLSRDDVVHAYRFILGREPESEAVIEAHRRNAADLPTLRRSFLASEELRAELDRAAAPVAPPPAVAALAMDAPPLSIETATDPETLARLVAHTARFWESIGETAPHWSVITDPAFGPENIAQNEDAFFRSAEPDRVMLLGLLRRIGRKPADFRTAVEFGCGVGRFTRHLAELFPQVVGLDISRPHLRLAAETMARGGFHNLRVAQVTPQDLHPVSGFDFWFSRIVLQHNPPPVILHILDRMFSLLQPGGVSIFQVPTYFRDYRFSIDDYLNGAPGSQLEMHCVPQRAVLALAERHGCRLMEMREDSWVIGPDPDRYLSNTYVYAKV